ncbi:MAG: phage BR0599 family protein [Candidatus Sedimenticola sp. 6PFRAG5]
MTYQDLEHSAHSGQPQELYRFSQGANRWLYTSGQVAVDYQSEIYQPASISRGGLEQGNELGRLGIEIRVPRDLSVVNLFLAAPPEGVVSVTIYRRHADDAEFITYWKGRVSGSRLTGSEATLKCEPIASSLKRTGLRAHFQLLCRHVLYSSGCGALKDSFRVDGTLAAVSGVAVQVAAAASQPDGYFVGGMLATPLGARMIVGHISVDLTLVAPMVGLVAGDAVQLYAGCDHTTTHCKERFNNLDNYGGFPFIPVKNPFSGDAIV